MLKIKSPNKLEVKGTLRDYPLCELLAEASLGGLTGSFRLSNDPYKVIIYLENGEVVYAVSNERQHRLYELLLRWGQIKKEQLKDYPDFTNDLVFGRQLVEKGAVMRDLLSTFLHQQLLGITTSALVWSDGEWRFDPLARFKESLGISLNLEKFLVEFSRTLPAEFIDRRLTEKRGLYHASRVRRDVALKNEDMTILSAVDFCSDLEGIINACQMPPDKVKNTIYTLWVAGYIDRQSRMAAFTESKMEDILSARLQVATKPKKTAPRLAQPMTVEEQTDLTAEGAEATCAVPENQGELNERISVEDFLARIDETDDYYEILAVEIETPTDNIKKAYFTLAQRFHPDKFHNEAGSELHQKLHHAFTKVSQAYETLKDNAKRHIYQQKAMQWREERAKYAAVKTTAKAEQKAGGLNDLKMAEEWFEQGFDLLVQGKEYEEALKMLARAATFAPNVAKYHAYYGKALSFDANARHKAEQEIQAAIKLDADNLDYRLMLAEFYVDMNMVRRAEGELKRLLTKSPQHAEARALLNSLASQ
jgi:curved DNA-binding protein CbpA